MTNGIPAGGALGRVRPEDIIIAQDHLYELTIHLGMISRRADDEVARVLASHDRITVREAIDAWRAVNRSLIEAIYRLDWIQTTIRSQRDGILEALEAKAAQERRELN
ncbi:hypothetical protein [Falsiroseomonas oryziterrae]|uniref:hypothetical protein n=1 Tax=Falsiroseomonas oryziterrae TaxID=2911368 RepID=UPI001F2DD137|nr:hypothetical protein [Roseomonas sp. NPKOSM-4]